jgi:hypothetical protein
VLARFATVLLVAAALPLNVAAVEHLRGPHARTVAPLVRTAGLDLLTPPPTTTTTAPPLRPGPPAAVPAGAPAGVGADPSLSCPATAVLVTVATAQPSYPLGQPVVATTTVVNRSPQACAWPGTVSFTWSDAYGESVQESVTDPEPSSVRWAPGQTQAQVQSWNQQIDAGNPAAPGPATVTVVWSDGDGGSYSGQAVFTIIDPSTTIPA